MPSVRIRMVARALLLLMLIDDMYVYRNREKDGNRTEHQLPNGRGYCVLRSCRMYDFLCPIRTTANIFDLIFSIIRMLLDLPFSDSDSLCKQKSREKNLRSIHTHTHIHTMRNQDAMLRCSERKLNCSIATGLLIHTHTPITTRKNGVRTQSRCLGEWANMRQMA